MTQATRWQDRLDSFCEECLGLVVADDHALAYNGHTLIHKSVFTGYTMPSGGKVTWN